MNNQNLIPFTSAQSREEAKKNGTKGGIASGKSKRESKAFIKRLREALNDPVYSEDVMKNITDMGMDGENATNIDAVVASLLYQAIVKHDTNAIEMVLSYLGESPKEQRESEKAKAQNDLAKAKAEAIRSGTVSPADMPEVQIYLPDNGRDKTAE